jgi:predicted DNA-binding protein (UPF0251 family)
MARPVKRRRICSMPAVREFGPVGRAAGEPVEMTVDEYESIRLMDRLGFSQEECALQMDVSRTTVQAIYDSARKKIALALVEGRRLLIGGGSYLVCPSSENCCGKECCRRECPETCGREGCSCCPGCAKSKEEG